MSVGTLEHFDPKVSEPVSEILLDLSKLSKQVEESIKTEQEVSHNLAQFEIEWQVEKLKDSLLTDQQFECRQATRRHSYSVECLEEVSDELNYIYSAITKLARKYTNTVELAHRNTEMAKKFAEAT